MTPERKRRILETLTVAQTEEPKEPPTAFNPINLDEVGHLFKTYSSQTSREASTERAARRKADVYRETQAQFSKLHPFAPSPRSKRDPLLFNRLSKPKTEIFTQREIAKRRNEESLSFQSPRSINSSIADRLIEQGEIDNLNREIRRQARVDSELADMPFSPKVDSASRLLSEKRLVRLPVHLRVQQEELNKKLILEAKRNEKDPDLTFTPKVNTKAKSRLLSPKRQYVQSEVASQVSTPRRSASEISQAISSFFARQESFSQAKASNLQSLSQVPSFSPRINANSSRIVMERSTEKLSDKYTRMSVTEAQRRKEKLDRQKTEEAEKLTFKPAIDPVSRVLARSLSFSTNGQKKMFEDDEVLSFSPNLKRAKRYVKVESFYRQGQPIMQTIHDLEQAKKQKLENLRKEREFLELKECCFAPSAKPLRVSKSSSEIRGMERFLELKMMADRKKVEQKKREEQVFKLKPEADGRPTVPCPFNLHPSKKVERLSKTQRLLDDKFRQECTFKPMRPYLR